MLFRVEADMPIHRFVAIFGLIILSALSCRAFALSPSESDAHLLVTFDSESFALGQRVASGFKGYKGASYSRSAVVRYLTQQLADEYSMRPVDDWPIQALNVHCVVYRIAKSVDINRLLTKLSKDDRVESVQRMQNFNLQTSNAMQYDDPYHDLQRGWQEASLFRAHELSTGKGIKVGIIDTAVERVHPDLSNAIIQVKHFVSDSERAPYDFHGTAVAGIIAAQANNGVGIVGVAPGARLYALEACWPDESMNNKGQCNSFTLAKAISWAIQEKLEVVNLSLAGPNDPLLRRLIEIALKNGVSIVAADGSGDGLSFPAGVPGVIAVSDIESRAKAGGNSADKVYAPGHDIMTTVPRGRYDFVSGNSMAAAHVTGLIALVRAYQPGVKMERISELLLNSVTAIDGDTDPLYIGIDACSLLLAVSSDPQSASACSTPKLVVR